MSKPTSAAGIGLPANDRISNLDARTALEEAVNDALRAARLADLAATMAQGGYTSEDVAVYAAGASVAAVEKALAAFTALPRMEG